MSYMSYFIVCLGLFCMVVFFANGNWQAALWALIAVVTRIELIILER